MATLLLFAHVASNGYSLVCKRQLTEETVKKRSSRGYFSISIYKVMGLAFILGVYLVT